MLVYNKMVPKLAPTPTPTPRYKCKKFLLMTLSFTTKNFTIIYEFWYEIVQINQNDGFHNYIFDTYAYLICYGNPVSLSRWSTNALDLMDVALDLPFSCIKLPSN